MMRLIWKGVTLFYHMVRGRDPSHSGGRRPGRSMVMVQVVQIVGMTSMEHVEVPSAE